MSDCDGTDAQLWEIFSRRLMIAAEEHPQPVRDAIAEIAFEWRATAIELQDKAKDGEHEADGTAARKTAQA